MEAEINRFSKKGNGLGQTSKPDGSQKTVEIPFTMPGDKVRFAWTKKRAGTSLGKLEELLLPAPNRQSPRCIHFGVCGGCRWQHVPYEMQLKIKEEIVAKCFADMLPPSLTIAPIIPCDPPWHYRNKMEFSFSSDAAGKPYLGLIMNGSRGKVLNLQECHLVSEWYMPVLKAVRQWWQECGLTAYHPPSNRGSLRTLTVREGLRTGDKMVLLTVSGNPEFALQQGQLDLFTAYLREAIEPWDPNVQLSIFLRIQQAVKGMATSFYEMLLHGSDHIREILNPFGQPLTFSISPSAFFQPNPRQAEKLYARALEMLNPSPNTVIYDLYCGTGTLSICAAKGAKQVIGIELSPESALDARTNIAQNGCKNVSIITGSCAEAVRKIREEKTYPLPDVVMVDPPRSGLDPETISHLLTLAPEKILYISCNPATQAENIQKLTEGGYELQGLQPVDQFPHTPHIENIAVLIKR